MFNRNGVLGCSTMQELNELETGLNKASAKSYNYDTIFSNNKDKVVFTLQGHFQFGKYSFEKPAIGNKEKGAMLADVWKIEPDYVFWLIENASGFAILPTDLEKMLNTPVFKVEDLQKENKLREIGNDLIIDLKGFSQKEYFRFHPQVGEYEYPYQVAFRQEIIKKNQSKIDNSTLTISEVLQGGNWQGFSSTNYKKVSKFIVQR
jgi:hypothetical protein